MEAFQARCLWIQVSSKPPSHLLLRTSRPEKPVFTVTPPPFTASLLFPQPSPPKHRLPHAPVLHLSRLHRCWCRITLTGLHPDTSMKFPISLVPHTDVCLAEPQALCPASAHCHRPIITGPLQTCRDAPKTLPCAGPITASSQSPRG